MAGKIFDAEFLKKIDTIAINAKMAMMEGGSGSRKSRAKGSSAEFSDFREYTVGDDFRRIDWNAYGRFDRLFVKLFMEEREALVNIFIDTSKSMDFGEHKKSVLSLKIAAVLAYLSLNNMDRICINCMKEGNLSASEAIAGKVMFHRCIKFLEDMEFQGKTDINACIKRKDFKGRGISIILSDFFTRGSVEDIVKYLLYKKQEVIFIHVLSKEELSPSIEGQVRLVDSETGNVRDVAVTPVLLRQYGQRLNSFTGGIREYCKRMGVSYALISSSDSLEKAVLAGLAKPGIIG